MALRTKLAARDHEMMVDLNPEERAENGKQLALALDELDAQQKELDTLKAEMKAQANLIHERIGLLRGLVTTGRIRLTVAVVDWADHEKGIVETTRQDTGEVVESRSMTQEERQLPIDMVGPQELGLDPEGT